MVFCYTIAVMVFFIGMVFFTGKGKTYIKGYAAMPEEEKKRIPIKALCRNLSAMFFIVAVIFGIAGFSEWFRFACLKWAMIGWLALGCADVLFINKSGRYAKESAQTRK